MFLPTPFASKELPDGRKLFRRSHGYTINLTANGNTVLSISVPYTACKINEIEVIGCPFGVKADLKVLDTPTGTVSGVPNYMLNQFGYDVIIASDYYKDHSPYDADLVHGMQIEITLKNSTSATNEVGINIPFHQVV